METNGYTLSDLATVTGNMNGLGGNNSIVTLLLLFALLGGGGFGWNNRGDYGQYATAASQQEILFGQRFNSIDDKLDRGFSNVFNGISDATFALNNVVKDGNSMVAGTVINESRGIQDKLYDVKTAVHAEGEATRAMIQQNKIEALQAKVNQLEMANQMVNVVRYPNGWSYDAGASPFCNNGCGNCCR